MTAEVHFRLGAMSVYSAARWFCNLDLMRTQLRLKKYSLVVVVLIYQISVV